MPPLDKSRNHRIALGEAVAMTRSHRQAVQGDAKALRAGAYLKDQILEVLNQAGCEGIRIYLGRDTKGEPTMVAVGIDANMNDLTQGTLLEYVWPCPPFCNDTSALNA